MSAPPSVAQWAQLVATQLPHLSRPQATVLAWWSLGLVLARSCGLTAVSVFLASLQDRKEHTVRQQLREWCYEAPAKRGTQRRATRLRVEMVFRDRSRAPGGLYLPQLHHRHPRIRHSWVVS